MEEMKQYIAHGLSVYRLSGDINPFVIQPIEVPFSGEKVKYTLEMQSIPFVF